jgi:hypothetical protein
VTLLMNAIPTVDRKGEDTDIVFPIDPTGQMRYKFCGGGAVVDSVVGDRTILGVVGKLDHAAAYTHTPVPHFGEGRAAIKATITVVSVRSDLYDKYLSAGTCSPPWAVGARANIIECRPGCVNGPAFK